MRRAHVAWIALAFVLALGPERVLPTAREGPLAGTLLMLPAVALLFWRAARLAGPTASLRDSGLRAVLASSLLLVGRAAPLLGLRWGTAISEPVLVAGLFALLFWQAASTLMGLTERGSVAPDHDRAVALVMTLLAVYLGILPWMTAARPPDGDEPYYLLVTHSLAYDFDTDLTNNYEQADSLAFMPRLLDPQPGDPVGPGGEQYSRHNMILPLLLALPYRLGGATAAFLTMALLTALVAAGTLRLADAYFPQRRRESLLAAGLLGLTPPLLLYSHQVWAEVPAALLTVWGWEAALRLRRPRAPWRVRLQMGVACLLLPIIKLRFLAVAAPLGALAFFGATRSERRLLVRLGLALLMLLALILVFNQIVFGNPLKHHGPTLLLAYLTSPLDYLKAPVGLSLDSAFGLLLIAPVWLLVVSGLAGLWRAHRRLLFDAMILTAPYLLLLAPRGEWYGGWSPPCRYVVVFLPAMALVLVPVLARRGEQGTRLILSLLLTATAVLTLVALLLPGWTYNFADGRSHLLDALTVAFGSDVARFFPSVVRPRTATWVWALSGLFLLIAPARWFRGPAAPSAASWGIGLFLLGLVSLPLAAAHVPLTTIEFEDPYVEKTGGRLHPDRWMPARVHFRGAWALSSGDAVRVPLPRRGSALTLEIVYRPLRVGPDAQLEILGGGRAIGATAIPPATGWNTLVLGPLDWPQESRDLELRLAAGQLSSLLLDRCRVEWR